MSLMERKLQLLEHTLKTKEQLSKLGITVPNSDIQTKNRISELLNKIRTV